MAPDQIDQPRTRKILTLDGGGVHGALSVEIPSRIEEVARARGAETLSDYFDYISGSAPYRPGWPSGEERMLFVAVGTGTNPMANAGLAPGDMNLLCNATTVPSALMFAAQNEQDFLCCTFGKCLSSDPIDREVGHIHYLHDAPAGEPYGGLVDHKPFTDVRYNVELTAEGLDRRGVGDIDPGKVQKIDSVVGIPDLQRVGRAVAMRLGDTAHFEGFDA